MTSLPRVRPGRAADIEALLALARAGGSGLTNLPAHRAVLLGKLEAGERALADPAAREAGAPVLLVTEIGERIVGTGCIFARVGAEWPFCSYRITRQAQTSRALGRATAQRLLNLVHDFDGEVEVGGLFVDPGARGVAVGALTARSRYLFIALHREWFGRRVMAELRGWQDPESRSPVWEAIGRRFYDMDFHEADRINAVEGNQFIADLGPRYPIYVSMLSQAAQDALGRPHDDGRRAHAMLREEGFRDEGYVDIFDGGPTLFADIDDLRSVREGLDLPVRAVESGDPAPERRLLATGSGASFRAVAAPAAVVDGAVAVENACLDALEAASGTRIRVLPPSGEAMARAGGRAA